MLFMVGYADGEELFSLETLDGADSVCEAERKIEEATGGNIDLVLIEPSLQILRSEGAGSVSYKGNTRVLRFDYSRYPSPSWSLDGQHWESLYHAIERVFEKTQEKSMGYVKHHAIVVTSYSENVFFKARDEAQRLKLIPSLPVKSPVNSYLSFFIPPDGSKEGWADSDVGDTRREEFKTWLRAQAYEDGSSPYEWVEIAYGSDDEQAVVNDSQWPSPPPSLEPPVSIEPPQPLCANDLYKIKPVDVTNNLSMLLPHVEDQVPYSSHLTDLEAKCIETRVIDTRYFAERCQSWELATIWFCKKPVMIIQSFGHGIDGHKKRYITDQVQFRNMCQFLRVAIPYEDASDDIIPPTLGSANLYTFAGGTLDNFATVD